MDIDTIRRRPKAQGIREDVHGCTGLRAKKTPRLGRGGVVPDVPFLKSFTLPSVYILEVVPLLQRTPQNFNGISTRKD
jgi:hypothetical protein